MGRQYTRKYKGGESQQEILSRLTEDAVKITKDIEALRDSLKTPEVPINEEIVEEKEDDNKYQGLSDMFSIKDFVQKSEQAKKVKKVNEAFDNLKEDDNKYQGLSDMFSIKDFVQKSEQAKKVKKEKEYYIQKIQEKIARNTKSKGNRKPSNDRYYNAVEQIEKANNIDDIMNSLHNNDIRLGINSGNVKGGKTKKLQKKSKKTQRKSHRK